MAKHKGEEEVRQAMTHHKNSSERKKSLTTLRLKGDYHHNMRSLETGDGELIVVRRPGENESCTIDDFLPCEFCLGFMKRWDLWKHQLTCEHKPCTEADDQANSKNKQAQLKAKLMLAPSKTGSSNGTLNKIIGAMKIDSISKIVTQDSLIKEFGSMLIEKQGGKDAQFISQKMRELARLVEGLMSVEGRNDLQLSDFLTPEKFDTIVRAIRYIAGFREESGHLQVGIPSLALKIGYSIHKCCSILTGQALRSKDDARFKAIKNFQKIMRSEWEYRVSHHSLTSLHERRFNKVHMPPLAEDMACLQAYIDGKISEESKNLREDPNVKSWTMLAKLLLSRAIMLNKRRGGEASKLLINSYSSRPDWTMASNSELMASLSSWEQRLSAE